MTAYRTEELPTSSELRDHHCPRCDLWWPRAGLPTVALGHETGILCPTCRGLVVHHVSILRRPLWPIVLAAPRDAVSTEGIVAIVALALAMAFLPRVGTALAVGYLMAVVRHTAQGEDGFPLSQDFTHWIELLKPLFRLMAAALTAVIPLLVVIVLGGDSPVWVLARLLATLLAAGFLPAAIAHASYCQTLLAAVNPLPAIALIVRIPREYALLTGGLGLLAVLGEVIHQAIVSLFGLWMILPVIPAWIVNSVSLVVPVVMARVLGLVLRERAVELGLEVHGRAGV